VRTCGGPSPKDLTIRAGKVLTTDFRVTLSWEATIVASDSLAASDASDPFDLPFPHRPVHA
jgi:hypothetical protein